MKAAHAIALVAGLFHLAAAIGSCSRASKEDVRADPAPTASPKPPPPPPPPPKWTLTLERRACYGYCPVYVVSVDQDGRVAYEGKAFVHDFGKRTAQASAADASGLHAIAQDLDFASLKPRYAVPCTDHDTAVVTFALGSSTTTVEHYGPGSDCGGGSGAPPKLLQLENEIDRVANTKPWTTCPRAGGDDYCSSFDGDAAP